MTTKLSNGGTESASGRLHILLMPRARREDGLAPTSRKPARSTACSVETPFHDVISALTVKSLCSKPSIKLVTMYFRAPDFS